MRCWHDSAYSFMPLLLRAIALTCLLGLEIVFASEFLDTESLLRQPGIAGWIGRWGPAGVRFAIAFMVAFSGIVWTRPKSILPECARRVATFWPSWRALTLHAVAAAAFSVASLELFSPAAGAPTGAVEVIWILTGMSAAVLACAAFLPVESWRPLAVWGGTAWPYAGAVASGVMVLWSLTERLWGPTASLTFTAVKWLLQPVLPGLIADPRRMLIGSDAFSVIISPECSGLEGAAMILVFGAGSLLLFRREWRFPQALLLLPAGVAAVWLLNCVRIAVLILIGNAGAAGIAMGGFHSQAGWIGFNLVGLAMTVAGSRIPWVSRPAARIRAARNPVAPYLVPLLAILLASMLSRAISDGAFERFYGLRLLAAAAALWCYRNEYRTLEWRAGWLPAALGALVFALWIAAERLNAPPHPSPIPSALAAMSPIARGAWLAPRVIGAAVTVPIAEELAFRAFLLRRLTSRDFESVDPRRPTLLALVISSLVFGALHGNRWIAGAIAGALYALAYARRGRISDAILAHAVTNALLAALVLASGNWDLW